MQFSRIIFQTKILSASCKILFERKYEFKYAYNVCMPRRLTVVTQVLDLKERSYILVTMVRDT